MPTSIKELIGKDITEAEIQEMAAKCSNNGLKRIGNFKKLQMEDMVQIYQMAK
jgi:alcohol dehydrogenase